MSYSVNYIDPSGEVTCIGKFDKIGMAIEFHSHLFQSFIMKALESIKNSFMSENNRRMTDEELITEYLKIQQSAHTKFTITPNT